MYGNEEAPQFSKCHAGVPATSKQSSPSLWQPLEFKLEKSLSFLMHEAVLYDMALVDLGHALMTKVTPWISSSNNRFDTFDQLFDCAAPSEFKPDDNTPG